MKSSSKTRKHLVSKTYTRGDLTSSVKLPIVVYALSLVALVFRFDWSESQGNSLAAFTLSFFMYTLVYWSSKEFLRLFAAGARLKTSILIILSFVCTFPYNLFTFDKYYYYRNTPYQFKSDPTSNSRFIEGLLANSPDISFPGKLQFFALLSIIFILLLYFARRGTSDALSLGLLVSTPIVMIQVWFNSSAGSAYSWVPTFEQPISNAYSYVVYKFPNGSAAVNADDFVHTSMISLFQNGTFENLMLFRRPLPYYLVSQLSFFVNSYYVWLLLNIAIWVGSTIIFSLITKNMNFSKSTRIVAMTGYSSAPLVLTFIGQPSTYVFTALGLSFYLYVVNRALVIETNGESGYRAILFSTLLFILTYVSEPWIAVIFLTVFFLRKLPASKLISILITSITVGILYRVLFPVLLDLEIDKSNEALPARTLKEAYLVVMSGNWPEILIRLISGLSGFVSSLTMMLFVPIAAVILLASFLNLNMPKSKKITGHENSFYLKSAQNLFFLGLLLQIFWSLGGNSWFGQFTHHISLLIFPSFILFAMSLEIINRVKQPLGTVLGLIAVAFTVYTSEPGISGMRQPMYQNFYGHSSTNL